MYNTYAKKLANFSAVTMITARIRPEGGKTKCANTKLCTF